MTGGKLQGNEIDVILKNIKKRKKYQHIANGKS